MAIVVDDQRISIGKKESACCTMTARIHLLA
jgi:hypothetical protein